MIPSRGPASPNQRCSARDAEKRVRPKGFEPLTLGSEGRRRFRPKLNTGKELRQLTRGKVLAVVLYCLPLIVAYCISLHPSRIFGALQMLSMHYAKWLRQCRPQVTRKLATRLSPHFSPQSATAGLSSSGFPEVFHALLDKPAVAPCRPFHPCCEKCGLGDNPRRDKDLPWRLACPAHTTEYASRSPSPDYS